MTHQTLSLGKYWKLFLVTLIINANYSSNIVNTAIVLVINSSLHNGVSASLSSIYYIVYDAKVPVMAKFPIFL